MKVLIVDDEIHVITAVRLLVPWDELGVTSILQASSPQEAIQLLECEQPELMITDIVMQDLTGIDLMEYINQSKCRTKVIVISGYDNFEYVRSSLQNGGIDYLLKPLDRSQLICAVKKAIESWNQEEAVRCTVHSHEDRIHSMASLCRENLLLRLLTKEETERSLHKLLQICPELDSPSGFGFAYCSLLPFLTKDSDKQSREFSLFRSQLSGFLEQNAHGFIVPSENPGEIRIFLTSTDTDFINRLEQFLSECRSSFSFPPSMGFSSSGMFPERISETLEEAKEAYSQIDAKTFLPCLNRKSSDRFLSGSVQSVFSDAGEKLLLSSLLTGNGALILQSVRSWLDPYLSGDPSLFRVLEIIEEEHRMILSWSRMFEKRHKGFYHEKNHLLASFSDLCSSESYFSAERLAQRIAMDLLFLHHELKQLRSPEADMIYQVAHYIELNYDRPFSQTECARLFFVNKEYMCRKFKQTFGVNMITYLNDLRIHQAKQLLIDPSVKIRDIAYQVGFEDEKYFSRQFKKFTGLTPGEYRNSYKNG